MCWLLRRFSTALSRLHLYRGTLIFQEGEPVQLPALQQLELYTVELSQPWLRILYASSVREVTFNDCFEWDTEEDGLLKSAGALRSVKLYFMVISLFCFAPNNLHTLASMLHALACILMRCQEFWNGKPLYTHANLLRL